jgi:hypothetical protein
MASNLYLTVSIRAECNETFGSKGGRPTRTGKIREVGK